MGQRYFLAIDGKSFYASCECADRHLDPLTTNLVVADATKTDKTICLAVSPSLKALGLGGRCRLYEVVQRVKEANAARLKHTKRFFGSSYDATALAEDPSLEISYIVAPPRMARYMEISANIYATYLKYISPEDIHVYSIDEVFLDVTGYLKTYRMSARELAVTMIRSVLYETGITATCGIGSNLYLAKVAMDIVAKKAPADQDGVRIAELDEMSYRRLLWAHRPLTDFWRVGRATAQKLERKYIYTMGDLARFSLYGEEWLYKTFGVDAEILIDHAWGIEPVQMRHIKAYTPAHRSISEGQVLTRPYPCDKARVIVREMAESIALQLCRKNSVTDSLTLTIGYDRENCERGGYTGPTVVDGYGRTVPKSARGSTRLAQPGNLSSQITAALLRLFEEIVNPGLTIRRITISAGRLTRDTGELQTDLFTDTARLEKERRLQHTMLALKARYGGNAILRGTSYTNGATGRVRNRSIGGHHE